MFSQSRASPICEDFAANINGGEHPSQHKEKCMCDRTFVLFCTWLYIAQNSRHHSCEVSSRGGHVLPKLKTWYPQLAISSLTQGIHGGTPPRQPNPDASSKLRRLPRLPRSSCKVLSDEALPREGQQCSSIVSKSWVRGNLRVETMRTTMIPN